MKRQVVFIHGGDSFTKPEDFHAHLKQVPLRNLPGKQSSIHFAQTLPMDLGDDFEVFMPSMPNKQNADYEEWAIWFERHFDYLSDDVALVGWSLGGMFLAKYLSEKQVPFKIGKVVLLAAPFGVFENIDGNDCGNFQFDPKILKNLPNNAQNIFILHSDDDFVVPVSAATLYKNALPEAKLILFSDKNHFLTPTFTELLSILNQE